MQETVTSTLARHMAEARFSGLPTEEVAAAKMSIIDVLGSALAAKGSPGTDAVLEVCRFEQSVGRSTVWVTGERVAPRQAAFVNSVFAAALDYDSVFHRGVVHSDIVVVPTAIAVGEAVASSGEELLAAVAYGNDLLCRLSLVSPPPRKAWFFTSIYGGIVAAAMTARLLKCDSRQIAHAMGLALFNAGGTYQPMTERSSSKQALAAFAVQAGIHSGYLAAAGFEGVAEPLEGAHGILKMYEDGDLSVVTEDLGRTFLGSQVGRKPFPSCQCNHAPIEAVLQIQRDHGVSADDVAEIEAFLSPHACRIVGAPYDGQNPTQMSAQFSVQYSLACTLVRGKLGIDEIKRPAIADSRIVELAGRVRIKEDPSNPNTYVPASVTVLMRDGSRFSRTVSVNRGGVELPMSHEDMLAKFTDCMMSSSGAVSSQMAERIFLQLLEIHQLSDVTSLIAMTKPDAG
jgi:2-methylcitrate dehydratase PrpD